MTISRTKRDTTEFMFVGKIRRINRLIFMYRVVEGLLPAIPTEDFLKPIETRRQIKGKQFKDHDSYNIIERHIINNNRGFTKKIILRKNSDRVPSSGYRDNLHRDSEELSTSSFLT